MMDFSKNLKLEPESPRKKSKNDDLQSNTTHPDNVLSITSPELGVDELSLILSSYWISTKDLLNFRLVNKSWCDAATTTLLQRDACFVSLRIYCNPNQSCLQKQEGNKCNLDKLTDLIDHSHKFPATAFRIYTTMHYKARTDYSNYPDLMLFFELYGKKIKTLGAQSLISPNCLLDILTVYTPNLECLDLSGAKLVIENINFPDDLKQVLKTLPFKSLHLSKYWIDHNNHLVLYNELEDNGEKGMATVRKLFHFLLSSFSKLICIENVTPETLGSVLREGKGQLVRSFKWEGLSLSNSLNNILKPTVMQFAQLNPKLSTVFLNLETESNDTSGIDVPFMNAFIMSFKDTVQTFSLGFSLVVLTVPGPLLKIPPMKCLKFFGLTGCDEIDPVNLRKTIFEFEEGISAENYFPSLRKVSLNSDDYRQASMMSFFAFKSKSDGHDVSVWDSLSKVEVLEVNDSAEDVKSIGTGDNLQEPRPKEAPLCSEIFPNIRILKLMVRDAPKLADAWWEICPNVEFMEINKLELINSADASNSNVMLSLKVDKFFTGFPLELCSKLRTAELPQEILHNPELLQFLRVAPSVCDLRNLKELKLRFSYYELLPTEFATKVTGKYAFSRMPNTKFIISYNPKKLASDRADAKADLSDESENDEENGLVNDGINVDGDNQNVVNFDKGKNNEENIEDQDDIEKYEELCFGSLRPYAQILREEYPDDWW